MEINNLDKMLEGFNKIPKKEKGGKTYLEIARCPHHENVWSNILAFYLNPKAEHGFGDMLLRTFMQLIGEKDKNYDPNTVKIHREYRTANNNRLDIVIETDTFVLGIENKVRAELNNDLFDYSNTIEELANGKQTFNVVLSKNNCACDNDFKNVLYNDFIQEVKPSIEFETKNKYQILFQDFLDTINNEINYNPMNDNQELVEYFTKNHVKIAELLEYSKWMNDFVYRKLESIHKSLTNIFSQRIVCENFNSEFYQKSESFCSFLFFTVNGYHLCCEIGVKVNGVEFWTCFYPTDKNQTLKAILDEYQYPFSPINKNEIIVSDIETLINEVINNLSK